MDEVSIVIRDAAAREHDAMLAMTVAAYSQYAEALSAEWWTRYQHVLHDALSTTEQVARIVAVRGRALLGGVLLFPASDAKRAGEMPGAPPFPASPAAARSLPMIRLLAVVSGARGQGIGGLLMDECLNRARRSGAKAIELHTMEVMGVARRMYERMGFVRAPELDFSPRPDLLVMGYRLVLAPMVSS